MQASDQTFEVSVVVEPQDDLGYALDPFVHTLTINVDGLTQEYNGDLVRYIQETGEVQFEWHFLTEDDRRRFHNDSHADPDEVEQAIDLGNRLAEAGRYANDNRVASAASRALSALGVNPDETLTAELDRIGQDYAVDTPESGGIDITLIGGPYDGTIIEQD